MTTSSPLVVDPTTSGCATVSATGPCGFVELVATCRDDMEQLLAQHGALMLRGFEGSLAELGEAIARLSGEPLPYVERSSPRTQVADGFYTSTDYPAAYEIFLHNEQSYNRSFPARLYFSCRRPAPTGGATLLADCRRLYHLLPEGWRDRLASEGYRLVRNYHPGLGLSWQEAFQTDDQGMVDQYCAANQIDGSWHDDELRTVQVRPALAQHPRTGELTWFNHATFFNVWSLDPTMAEVLVDEYGEDGAPTNTSFADGEPFSRGVLDQVRAAYRSETAGVDWKAGDLLVIDNLLMAHGRAAYAGPREVVVAMSGTCRWDDVVVSDR